MLDLEDLELVREVQKKLATLATPWEEDGSIPPKLLRKDGLGRQVGIVDPHLGGYAAWPRGDGPWGYKAQKPGNSSNISGHVGSVLAAQELVDQFLRESNYTLLENPVVSEPVHVCHACGAPD